jgi:PAP2 superfamily
MDSSKSNRYLIGAILTILAIGIGMSRIYLGVHSFMQIFTGGILAACYCHLFLFHYYDKLMRFVYLIMSQKFARETKRSILNLVIIFALLFNFIGVLAYIVSIEFKQKNYDVYEQQMLSLCALECNKHQYKAYLGWKDFRDYLYGNLLFGLLVVYLTIEREPFTKNNRFFVGQTIGCKIKRLLALLVVGLVSLIPMVFCKMIFFSKKADTICSVLVGYTLSFGLMWILPKLYSALGVSVKGDFVNFKQTNT